MARFIFVLPGLLLLYFSSLCAHPFTIRGPAASTLYICDKTAIFNCWYSKPHSYCEIDPNDHYNLEIGSFKGLFVTGETARNIHLLTKDCYDLEPKGFEKSRYDYGSRGVNCWEFFNQVLCLIDVDFFA